MVCADSHTATSGGLGAWAWGIGTTQVLHVLATQMLILRKPQTMRVTFNGRLGRGVYAKDMILSPDRPVTAPPPAPATSSNTPARRSAPADRGPADDLQHVGRVRRPRGPDRRR